MSLTGDAITDSLVPIAQRLIGAVRTQDADLVEELLGEAILATGGRCDPGTALAVVCAAMVPDQYEPSVLLRWRKGRSEYERLVEGGVSPEVARRLVDARKGAA